MNSLSVLEVRGENKKGMGFQTALSEQLALCGAPAFPASPGWRQRASVLLRGDAEEALEKLRSLPLFNVTFLSFTFQ